MDLLFHESTQHSLVDSCACPEGVGPQPWGGAGSSQWRGLARARDSASPLLTKIPYRSTLGLLRTKNHRCFFLQTRKRGRGVSAQEMYVLSENTDASKGNSKAFNCPPTGDPGTKLRYRLRASPGMCSGEGGRHLEVMPGPLLAAPLEGDGGPMVRQRAETGVAPPSRLVLRRVAAGGLAG